jgi:hypothetical protein
MHWDTKEDFEKQEWYFYLISINEVSLIAIANQLPNLTKLTGPRFEGRSWGWIGGVRENWIRLHFRGVMRSLEDGLED